MKIKTIYTLSIMLVMSLMLSACSIPVVSSVINMASHVVNLPAINFGKATPSEATATPSVAITPVPAATFAPTSSAPVSGTLGGLQEAFEKVYTDVNPSVVNIQVLQKPQAQDSAPTGPEMPFGFPGPDAGSQPQEATGSGFIYNSEGHIVTNNHVVDGADKVTVNLSDGTSYEAKVVGTDPDSDLAVVKIDAKNALKPVEIGDSNQIKVGQVVIAIGNPYGLSGTMTQGIVSAIGRSLPVDNQSSLGGSFTIPNVIQTDASINPGNSGGVLLNLDGQVLGVTSAIRSPVKGSVGIGFVIPSSIVQRVVPSLIVNGRYAHPWLGISGTALDSVLAKAMDMKPEQRGALVKQVAPDSPADKAGIKGSDRQIDIDGQKASVGGDVITAIDGQPVKEMNDLIAYLTDHTVVEQVVKITLLRDGKEQVLDVKLAERPAAASNVQSANESGNGAQLGIIGKTLDGELAKAMNLQESQSGVLVVEVNTGSPADLGGLHGSYKPVEVNGQRQLLGGDVITQIDGTPVETIEQLKKELQNYKKGEKITLTILRDGDQKKLEITL